MGTPKKDDSTPQPNNGPKRISQKHELNLLPLSCVILNVGLEDSTY